MAHVPGWLPEIAEDLWSEMFTAAELADVVAERLKVRRAYESCSSRKELAARLLFMADGSISYCY